MLLDIGIINNFYKQITSLIVFPSFKKVYLEVNISQLSYINSYWDFSPSFIANIVKIALEGLCNNTFHC